LESSNKCLNKIQGIVKTGYMNLSESNLTFTSILYGNGPGGLLTIRTKNLTDEQTGKQIEIIKNTFYE
jgi:hypothetical protein